MRARGYQGARIRHAACLDVLHIVDEFREILVEMAILPAIISSGSDELPGAASISRGASYAIGL